MSTCPFWPEWLTCQFRLAAGLGLILTLSPAPCGAQQPDPQAGPVPEVDLMDLVRLARHKEPKPETASLEELKRPMIVAAPIISSNPSTGTSIGAAMQVALFRGDPKNTRISSGIASLTFSSQKDMLLNVRFSLFTDGNRWLINGDNRFNMTAQNLYGLGTDTPTANAVGTDYNFVRLHETVYRQVRPALFVGGGFLFDSHSDVQAAEGYEATFPQSQYVSYSQQHGLPATSQQSAGFSVDARLDTRDNSIDPRRGWMAEASYRMSFDGLLGGDSSWQLLHFDLRAYPSVGGSNRRRLALWLFGDLQTHGNAPYYDLPATVMDLYGRSARSYREGRYRGERLVYGEVEYRDKITANGLLGYVVFANATTVSNLGAGQQLFESLAPATGAGLRFLFNKRSKTNLCLDFGWGKDGSHGFYLALQDAF